MDITRIKMRREFVGRRGAWVEVDVIAGSREWVPFEGGECLQETKIALIEGREIIYKPN